MQFEWKHQCLSFYILEKEINPSSLSVSIRTMSNLILGIPCFQEESKAHPYR